MKTIIVGGVAGGATAAARLRRLDEKAEIVMFERGEYVSFANCGLPYYIGGVITDRSALTLQTPQSFLNRFNVDVRVNSEVVDIDPSKKVVTVKESNGNVYKETYDKLILSPGAKPVNPPIPGTDSEGVFTLRNIPDTDRIRAYVEKLPEGSSAVVVGGGYIGVEMAENLTHAGLKVTVVELADHLIASLDYDVAADVHQYIRKQGINLILGDGVKEIKRENDKLYVKLGECVLETDMLLMSVGVRPETDLAVKAGVEINARGAILVDDDMRTNVADIYAVGDAIEVKDFVSGMRTLIPLAGPANKQGRVAADNICGIDSQYTGTQGSAILKLFDMTVATTGMNEKAAKNAGIDYDKVFLYIAPHAGYYPGGQNMAVKVVFERETGKILGAQIVGFDGVDKRCDVFATAIRFGATAKELTKLELCYAPPFGSAKDPVNMVGFVIENILTGKVKQYHWHDVAQLPRDGSVTLLDVRTEAEHQKGAIEGFMNIPLDELRQNLDRIPKDKPVYVHCLSGLRSYIACRELIGNGYECFNLGGGYRLWNAVVNQQTTQDYCCYKK